MDPGEIRSIVRGFLDLVKHDPSDGSELESQLCLLLDRLALAQNFVIFEFDEKDYPDPPEIDYSDLVAQISHLFRDYGYYNVPEYVTEKVGESGCVVGDAIDDLADITRDLANVEWCWSNTSEADALWHFQNSYRTHWREHLRRLQIYLHSRELGI